MSNYSFPTISIVTPSFNQGRFLAETIESIICQEGDFYIDYIIVDGGSTDNSVEIIKQYDTLIHNGSWQAKCCGITYRWLSEADGGQTDALIKGFRIATGDILAWLNSDDTYLPETLQTAATFFRDYPDTGLMYGDARYCDESGQIIGRYRTEGFDYDKLAWFNFICQPATFFRKNVFAAVGGLDEKLRFAMDYDLWVRIGRRFACRHIPRLLSTYRLHETSKTIRLESLYENCEEALHVAMQYFDWAPLTRVYNSCHAYCRAHLPEFLLKLRPIAISATIMCTLCRSIALNHGFNGNDLKLLSSENFRKLFKSRTEIMTGKKV